MKKKILFLFILMFFSVIATVNAEELTCYYTRQHKTLQSDIIVTVSDDGTVSAKWALDKASTYLTLLSKNIVYKNFLKNNGTTLSCTSNLYVRIDGTAAFEIYSQYDESVFYNKACDNNGSCYLATLDSSKSSGDITINQETPSMTCEYNSMGLLPGSSAARILYSVIDGKPVFSQKGGETVYTLTAIDDFEVASSCDAQGSLYISCTYGIKYTCDVSSSKKGKYKGEIKLVSKEDETIKDGTEIDEDNYYRDHYKDDKKFNPKKLCEENDNCNISLANFCTDSNVSRTFKFLGLLFYVAKILIPAIVIIMGFVNLFKIMTLDKIDEAKKYARSIVVRIFVGIAIFLIPGIINAIYDGAKAIIGNGGTGGFDNCINCLLDPTSDKCYIEES